MFRLHEEKIKSLEKIIELQKQLLWNSRESLKREQPEIFRDLLLHEKKIEELQDQLDLREAAKLRLKIAPHSAAKRKCCACPGIISFGQPIGVLSLNFCLDCAEALAKDQNIILRDEFGLIQKPAYLRVVKKRRSA